MEFDGIPTRVLTAEHLCAICLKTGRFKDLLRVSQFIESDAVDLAALDAIIRRHGLESKRASVPNWPAGG